MDKTSGRDQLKYRQLGQHDECECRLHDKNTRSTLRPHKPFYHSNGTVVLITSILCFTILCSVWLTRVKESNLDVMCTEHISQFSPVVQDVGIRYHETRFNGSLLKTNVFREDAGPAVDAAWGSLGVNYRSLRIPAELAAKSNLLRDQVKVNDKYGGGFPANVEGLHHLHCLNLLRKALYYNFDYYHALGEGPFRNSDHILRFHVTHCLDIIRQQLMCTVDVGVLGQVWWNPEAPEAYVDFNTKHTCRNFEEIRKWAEERQMPAKVPFDWLQPPEPGDTVYETIP